MHTIFLDADACPVKEETYRVARRHQFAVVVVANAALRVPAEALVKLVVVSDRNLDAADDRIAELAGQGDIVVTADIILASRCLEKQALAVDPKGRPFTDAGIGLQTGLRDLHAELRLMGQATGGPPPMTEKDRSRFLNVLDNAVQAVRRAYPPAPEPARP